MLKVYAQRCSTIVILIFLQSWACKTAASQGLYSYEGRITVQATLFVKDTISKKQEISNGTLLLYKQYLIEPETKITLYNGRSPQTDTIGYYFIDLKNQVFSKYSALSVNAKKLKEGSLDKKMFGFNFYYPVNDPFKNVSDLSIRDTTINNVSCKIATAVKSTPKGKYLANGIIYPTPRLFPVQFSLFLARKVGGGFVKEMSLTKNEPEAGPKGILITKVNFDDQKLPEEMVDLIKTWSDNSQLK